jgi:hypothetical protein
LRAALGLAWCSTAFAEATSKRKMLSRVATSCVPFTHTAHRREKWRHWDRLRPNFCTRLQRFPAAPSRRGFSGDQMATNASALDAGVFADVPAGVEKRLWQAVIVTTIQEWLNGPLRSKRKAEQYLFQDERDFPLVCQSAGMDADRLRSKLTRLLRQNPALAASADLLNR